MTGHGDEGNSRAEEEVTTDELIGSEYNMPVALMDKRHVEKILGTTKPSGTWRMKERVREILPLHQYLLQQKCLNIRSR